MIYRYRHCRSALPALALPVLALPTLPTLVAPTVPVVALMATAMVAIAVAVVPDPALAQQQPAPSGGRLFHDDVAGNRQEGAAAEQPIMLGSFRVAPEVTVAGGYDTNIFNRPDATGDGFVAITPRLDIGSDWGGGSASFLGSGRILRYAKRTTENSEALNLTANGQLNLGQQSSITTSLSATRTPEPRGTGGIGLGAAEPVVRRELQALLGGRGQIGPLVYGGSVRALAQRYDPLALPGGGRASQRFRDLNSVGGQIQAGVALSGALVAFGQADLGQDVSPRADRTIVRDSSSRTFSLGLRGDITPLIAAQIVVGHRTIDYDLSRYRDFSGLSYNAIVDWYPRPLLSVRVESSRFFANSGLAESAGIDTQRQQVTLYYDPLRTVRIEFRGAYFDERYRNVALSTDNYELGLSGRYEFARRVAMTMDTGYRRRTSSNTAIVTSFDGLGTSLGIRFGL